MDESIPQMPERSRYAGQEIDVSSRRSIVIRKSDVKVVGIESGETHVVIDYFYHHGQFWTAVIPLNSVERVYGQMFNFSAPVLHRTGAGVEVKLGRNGLPKRKVPFLIHVQSRFILSADDPIKLFPLGSQVFDDPSAAIEDFVYSMEVVGPSSAKFNMRDAFSGNFVSAHRIMSTKEMVFERLVVQRQTITESPAIPIDDTARRTVLAESLLRSDRAGMMESYYLFRCCGTNNCTSNPLQILDRVVKYRISGKLGSLLYRLPLCPRCYLRVRGLDADPKIRKIVADEFREYIDDPSTRSRKKEWIRKIAAMRRKQREAG